MALKTICLKFLTREEKADVFENNFRCIRDIKEWAGKKYAVHFWNQSLLFNGKVLKNDYKNLFELFRENPNDSGTLNFQVLAAKTPFNIKVVQYSDSSNRKHFLLEVHEDDTIATVKEKLHVLKPNYPIPYISLCDYCDPRMELEDDKTLVDYGLQPRSSVELRRIITLNVKLLDKNGQTLKQDSFTYVSKYLDERLLIDLINDIQKGMDLPKATTYYFMVNGAREGHNFGCESIRNVVCNFGEEIHCIFKLL